MVRPVRPTPELAQAAAAALRTGITAWKPVGGGFSAAGLWVIDTAQGPIGS